MKRHKTPIEAPVDLLDNPEWRRVRNCLACGQLFEPKRDNQVKCKPNCSRYNKVKERTDEEKAAIRDRSLLAGTMAAAAELRVACHLLAIGWQVCRPLSYTCPFDLMAWKPRDEVDLVIKVQVKGAREYKDKLLCSPRKNNTHDILALVLPDRIVYLADDPSFYDLIEAPVLKAEDVLYTPTKKTPKETIKEPKKPRELLPPDPLAVRTGPRTHVGQKIANRKILGGLL